VNLGVFVGPYCSAEQGSRKIYGTTFGKSIFSGFLGIFLHHFPTEARR